MAAASIVVKRPRMFKTGASRIVQPPRGKGRASSIADKTLSAKVLVFGFSRF
jgi:hypothetical protein